jgi:hypothetical protein
VIGTLDPHRRRFDLADHRLELVGYGAILILAAILRLGDLAVRGTWDADQGHDMLVLRALVLDGRFPLLGPPTSIGDFHHGVLYYLLLAPAALLSRADPVAVTTWIACGGVAAVAVTGWLARSIAGPAAGLLAAFLLAVSSSAVEESTFIWNPNLIALSSSIALAAAWHAWHRRRSRWWLVAGAAAIVTMHCHVLGVILTPVIGGLLVADVRRRRRSGDRSGADAVGRAALGWLGLAAASYVPLAIHEIGSNGSELRAAIAFVTGGGGPATIALPARLPIVGLRVLGWPLTGLITAAPLATLLSAALVVGLAVWRGWLPGSRGGSRRPAAAVADPTTQPTDVDVATDPDAGAGEERTAVRWLALGLAWTVVALTVGASSLATVVAGLPNDHYHAFADPMVVTLVAVGLAGLARRRPGIQGRIGVAAGAPAAVGVAIVVALVAWNLAIQPPARAVDGGWDAARSAAGRVVALGGGAPLVLSSLPTFKSDEAVRMPLEALGADLLPATPAGAAHAEPGATVVILCDQLFREAIGADCGGPAEDAWLADPASGLAGASASARVTRFEAAPGRWISVYKP